MAEAQTVASLKAVITAETSQLKRGLAEAKTGLAGLRQQVESQTRPLADMNMMLTRLGVGIGLATSVVYAFKRAFDFGREGAELDFVERKFTRLALTIDTTSDALSRDLKIATRGMMSDAELMASASNLMALGLVKTHDEAVRLTKVAAALNMNMNQLVLTLTNQTTMRFDTLGVSVDGFKQKVEKLEKAGHDTNEAFRLAFLQQAEEQLRKVGERADTTAGSFDRLSTSWKNMMDEVKRQAAPPTSSVADWAAAQLIADRALKQGAINIVEYNEAMTDLDLMTIALGLNTRNAVQIFEEFTKKLAENEAQAKLTAQAQFELARSLFGELGFDMEVPLKEKLLEIIEESRKSGAEAGKVWTDEFKAQMSLLETAVAAPLGGEMESYRQQQEELLAKAAELRARIAEASQFPSSLEQQRELFNLRNELELTNEAVRNNAAEHETATKRILFSLLMQRIGMMELKGETATAAYDMAYSMALAWGIIDQNTYKALQSIDKGLGLLAQGNIKGAQAEILRLGEMARSVAGDYYINFVISTSRAAMRRGGGVLPREPDVNIPPGGFYPGGFGGGGGGGGAGMAAPKAPERSRLQKLLDTAGALSSLGSSAMEMLRAQLEPLRKRLEAIDELITPGHIDVYAMEHLADLQAKRAEAAEKIRKAEEQILKLQEQQQRLQFLETQVRLLEMIKEYKLNAKDILGGLKLGLNADMGEIIAATTRALAKLIEEIERKLEIGSPSKVMMRIGQQMMAGWSQGISGGSRRMQAAMDHALQMTIPGGAPGYGYNENAPQAQEININIPVGNLNSQIDIEDLAYRVAEVMSYRSR